MGNSLWSLTYLRTIGDFDLVFIFAQKTSILYYYWDIGHDPIIYGPIIFAQQTSKPYYSSNQLSSPTIVIPWRLTKLHLSTRIILLTTCQQQTTGLSNSGTQESVFLAVEFVANIHLACTTIIYHITITFHFISQCICCFFYYLFLCHYSTFRN